MNKVYLIEFWFQVSSNVVEKCFEITAIGVHAEELADERHVWILLCLSCIIPVQDPR